MKYYNIYKNGIHVILFDTDKFEIVSTWDRETKYDSKEFEEGLKYSEGRFIGYERKDDLIESIKDFINNLNYDPDKGSYLVMYPNCDWDMYDDFGGVYTKYEVRHNLVVFKQIDKLPNDFEINHWNGRSYLNSIIMNLCS